MSRGPGRLQRQIVKRLQKAPEGRLSRRELEALLVDGEGYTSSNLLRAIRGLARMNYVSLTERPDLERSWVSLPRPAERVSEEFIDSLLAEIGGRS